MDRRICSLAAAIIVAACTSDKPSAPEVDRGIESAIIPELQATLVRGALPLQYSQRANELTQGQAATFAAIYVRQFSQARDTIWAQQHGAPLDYATLRPCGRVIYAESAYTDVPADLIRPIRSALGPYWIVTLCARQRPAMAVAVSALATDLVAEGGRIHFPYARGHEFRAEALPAGSSRASIEHLSPEDAIVLVYSRTGARVRAVPRLINGRVGGGGPLNAVWRVDLEVPVALRGRRTGSVLTEQVVFVGRTGGIDADGAGALAPSHELLLADPQQPSADTIPAIVVSQMMARDPQASRRPVLRATGLPLVLENADREGN